MRVRYTNKHHEPSRELKFRFRKLCEIAALAKIANQNDLYEQAKMQYNSLASQYNSMAHTKEKGFWGKFLDNLTFTESSVHIQGNIEDEYNYQQTYSMFSAIGDKRIAMGMLKNAMKEWESGTDLGARILDRQKSKN